MKFFICNVALIASLLVAYVIANHPIRVRHIDVTQPEEGYVSSLGVVNGVRHCGGPGKVLEWRVDGCSGEGTCRLPAQDKSIRSEMEFIPSQDIDALGIRFLVIEDGTVNVAYDRPISDSAVQGGETYIVEATGAPTKELKGKTITAQYMLYRVVDGSVETCAEADFQIY